MGVEVGPKNGYNEPTPLIALIMSMDAWDHPFIMFLSHFLRMSYVNLT